MGFCFLYQENPTTALPMKASIAYVFPSLLPWAAAITISSAWRSPCGDRSCWIWRGTSTKFSPGEAEHGAKSCWNWQTSENHVTFLINLVGDTNVSDFLASWAAKGKVDHLSHEIQKLKRSKFSKALILQYEAAVHFLDFCKMPPGWWLSEIELNRIEPMSMQLHLAFLDRKGQPGS